MPCVPAHMDALDTQTHLDSIGTYMPTTGLNPEEVQPGDLRKHFSSP